MNNSTDSLGIIAGNHSLPFLIASEARKHGLRKIVAVAVEGETDPNLATLVDEIVWLRVGQLSKMIKAFKERGITQCVMAGQIAPKNLFDLRPDLRAMMLLFRLKEKNAHTILAGLVPTSVYQWASFFVQQLPVVPGILLNPQDPRKRKFFHSLHDQEFFLRAGQGLGSNNTSRNSCVSSGYNPV